MSLSPPQSRFTDGDLRAIEALFGWRDRREGYLLITRPNGLQGIVCCHCWRLSWAQSHVQQRVCPHCQRQEGHANA